MTGIMRRVLFAVAPASLARPDGDPWWSSYVAQARHVDEWLDLLRRPFRAAQAPVGSFRSATDD